MFASWIAVGTGAGYCIVDCDNVLVTGVAKNVESMGIVGE